MSKDDTISVRSVYATLACAAALFAGCVGTPVLAANQSQPAAGVLSHGGNQRNVGGVIDRSFPRPTTPTAPAGSAVAADSSMPQFNRIPDNAAVAGTPVRTGPAAMLPDADGGPALYTIVERPRPTPQVRPVIYITTPRGAKQSAKRYCTVTEISRHSSEGCR
jgi:hypothetical protein